MAALELANQLKAKFGELLSAPTEFRGEVTLKLADAARIAEVCEFAKKSLSYDMLLDLSSIDNYGEDPRWTVVYELYGTGHGCHLRLMTDVSEEKSELPTVTTVWRGADWHERECYDLVGVHFTDHPNLKRILCPEDWEGHPLRKDFPTSGYVEVRYDDEQKRVVYEPVKLTQEYRNFDFLSPWEAVSYDLPGDEKASK